jgi:hypothetical protein
MTDIIASPVYDEITPAYTNELGSNAPVGLPAEDSDNFEVFEGEVPEGQEIGAVAASDVEVEPVQEPLMLVERPKRMWKLDERTIKVGFAGIEQSRTALQEATNRYQKVEPAPVPPGRTIRWVLQQRQKKI